LIAACHFWSNGVNAFLFGHGPMSPTLADVWWPALISQDPCILTNTKAPLGKKEWK
jgi:hypothetical protein